MKNNNKEKKEGPIRFFISKYLIFTSLLLGLSLFATVFTDFSFYNKFGYDFILELFLVFLIIIFLILSKKNVLKEKTNETFLGTLKIGFPIIVLSILFLILNIFTLYESVDGNFFKFFLFDFLGNLINLIFYCLTIGLAEELLCRGWLQNVFIERFGTSRKKIIFAIILSSLLFGLMHLSNALVNQSLFETIMQVIQTTGMGFLFGVIYYRTKNIYAVAFLHALFDFSLMIPEINHYVYCFNGKISDSVFWYNLISSLLISLFYFLCGFYLFGKEKTNLEIKKEESDNVKKSSKKKDTIFVTIMVILLICLFIPYEPDGLDEYEICNSFDKKEIDYNNYEITYVSKEYFDINLPINSVDNINENIIFEKYSLSLNSDFNLVMFNKNNEQVAILEDDYVVFFEVLEFEDRFDIVYVTNDDYGAVINYNSIIKNEFENTKEFFDNFEEQFQSINVSSIIKIGYISVEDDKFIILLNDTNDIMIIDNDGKLKYLEFI